MGSDRLRALVDPLLEALAERVFWAPAVFLGPGPDGVAVACGSTPKDVALAREVVAEGRGVTEPALVAVDRWARVFPVTHGPQGQQGQDFYGHVVLMTRVAESNVPALARLVAVLGSFLAGEAVTADERGRRYELETTGSDLAARVELLDVDRRFHEELHQEIAAGGWHTPEGPGNLQRMVSCLARHLGSQVVLQARNLLILAEADGSEAPDGASIALCPGRHQSTRDIVQPLARTPGIVELAPVGALPRRLVAPVWGGGELLGFLTTAVCGAGEVGAIERSLECTAGFVAMERIIRSEFEEAQQLDREALLRDLCSGSALHRVVSRGLRLDVDLRRPYLPCAFVPAPGAAVTLSQLRSVVLDAFRETFGGTSDALAAVFDDMVVALVPEDSRQSLSGVCDRVVKHADHQGWRVRGGVGPACRELGEYETAVRKARWVTDALDSMDGHSWAQFDDFGIYAILFDKEQSTQLDDFVRRQLGALVAYDEDHRTDLVETLRCVLDTGAVLTEAAKQLFIHISTLKYRVNRIEELLGVELRNPQTAFDLHLACKILSVRRQLSGAVPAANDGSSAGQVPTPQPPRRRSKSPSVQDARAAD